MEDINFHNCPNLTKPQIECLNKSGIKTLIDFISAPQELLCSAANIKESIYCLTRQRILESKQPCPISLLQKSTGRTSPVSTMLPSLDKMLGGGLFAGDVVEVYGKTGSGKTQLCLYLVSQYCSNNDERSNVLYFDLKNDFNAARLLEMCGGNEERLEFVKVFREPNMSQLIKQLETIKNQFIGGINSFFSRCRFLVIDSVPMVMYPAAQKDFYSWRHYQEQLLRRLHWLAGNMNMSVVLVNHAVTQRDEDTTLVKPAMGKYWYSKLNISIHLEKHLKNPDWYSATLDKSYRSSCGQKFDFTIEPDGISECAEPHEVAE